MTETKLTMKEALRRLEENAIKQEVSPEVLLQIWDVGASQANHMATLNKLELIRQKESSESAA